MSLYKNKYRIEPARLTGFDYGSNAAYFITICTKNRINYFGNIVETHDYVAQNNETDNRPSLQETQMATIATQYWQEIPNHYPYVLLDEFIIMPNHIHGIIIVNKKNVGEWQENKFGVQSKNIPAIIRGFKSSVKRFANLNYIEFEWQSRYYDRIIRDDEEFNNIRNYIYNNPKNWVDDENYSP